MSFLRSVTPTVSGVDPGDGHPFDVPAIAAMVTGDLSLQFHRGVTVFVGDNGSGKSTLLEAITVHQGLNDEGGARGMQFGTRPGSVSSLHQHLQVMRSPRQTRDASFLRAESSFNVAAGRAAG